MNQNALYPMKLHGFRRVTPKAKVESFDDTADEIELPPRPPNMFTVDPKVAKENAQVIQILKAQRDEYQVKIANLKQQIEAKKQRNAKQKAQFEAQIKSDNDKKRKQEREIQQITEKIPDAPDFDYEKYKLELQEKVDNLLKEKEQAEKRVDELGRKLIESQQKLKDAREKIKSLPQAGNIEALQKAKRQMERERDSKISFYQKQLKDINEQCEELNQKLDESVKKGEKLQAENENLAETYTKLEMGIRKAQKKINFLKQRVDENGKMVTPEYVQQKLKEAENAKNQAISSKRQELEQKYLYAQNNLDVIKEELNDRISNIEQLNQKVNTLTQEIINNKERHKQELKAIVAQHKQNIAKLREQEDNDLKNALLQQRENLIAVMKISQETNL
ncbi:hypothetical protein TRFO_42571 [Tritrichomonas foetus]|uniref:Uncharacterized protein n=1 Tax=Tritrichomonas foetus TaxID=1144522 RepID=A0A1J4KVT8_9EUKA|nr:hypothetical protein TRFO_42571 [Tritrichomonas foetus]|eukprot:OHT15343.1 hypothetical protein TRFO_42571 [Tritrichomonas foetus]